MRRLFVLGGILAVTILASGAMYSDKALGANSESVVNDFPFVTSGPGYIMPDSRLYFLDKLYQEFKLAVALSPQERAKVHTHILGERLAELRVMQSRDNKEAIVTALTEVQRESLLAAQDIRDASAQGKDVSSLAKSTHQALKDYHDALLEVANRYPDTLYEGQLLTAADTLKEARMITETTFSGTDRDNELASNAQGELDDAVLGVATWAQRVENKFKAYEKYASGSAGKLTPKQREQRIVEIKKKIAELQAQLRELNASQTATIKVTPTPKTTR